MNAQDVLVASVIIIIIWWWSSWPPPPSSSFHYYFPKRCYTWPYIFFSSSWNYFLGSWDTILANCQVCFLLISSWSSSWAPLFLPHLIHTVSQDLILSPLSFSFWSDITQSNCSNYSYVNGISHSRCQIHLIIPGVKSISSVTCSWCPYLAVCWSPFGHPKSFKKKFIIFPLDQLLLHLFSTILDLI